jgi:hypothetical protein
MLCIEFTDLSWAKPIRLNKITQMAIGTNKYRHGGLRSGLARVLVVIICPSPTSLGPTCRYFCHRREILKVRGKERRRRRGKKKTAFLGVLSYRP